MPAARTSTTTWRGPATGSATSSIVNRVPPCQVATFIALLVVERDEDAVAQPAVERLREMSFARRVLDEDDLARADLPRLAVARGDLHAGVEVDDVLPSRRGMPVEIVVGLDLAEDDAGRRNALGRLARAAALREFDLDVAEVCLALGIDVEIVDSHARPPEWRGGGFYQRLFRRPPSTFSETPVMKLARSEQRNATASASSSGRPHRPSAFLRAATRRASSSPATPSSATRPA